MYVLFLIFYWYSAPIQTSCYDKRINFAVKIKFPYARSIGSHLVSDRTATCSGSVSTHLTCWPNWLAIDSNCFIYIWDFNWEVIILNVFISWMQKYSSSRIQLLVLIAQESCWFKPTCISFVSCYEVKLPIIVIQVYDLKK